MCAAAPDTAMGESFRVPRSRASQTHREMREEIEAALAPILFGAYQDSYQIRAALECAFAEEVQARQAVAVHSGTVALFIALRACGIGPGDEVVSVGNSDISTTGAIRQCGAIPVLCDVQASDYTMDPQLVEALINERTRAILPVDLHGHPADVKSLRAIADRHQLQIVEDAALATGARDHGRPVGAFADVTMFSFAPFKPLGSAGNGAMLVTDDDALAERIRLLVSYGHDPSGETAPGRQNYIEEGYNVPLDGLQAALVLAKLPHLPAWTARRRAIAAALEKGLAGTAVVTPRFRPESESTFRSYAITVAGSSPQSSDRQMELYHGLRAAGIEAVIHYAPPIYDYSIYADTFPNVDQLPVTDRLARQYVNLPVTPELTAEEVEYMIEATRKILA